MSDPIDPQKVIDAINSGQAIVCYSQCYSCMAGCCYDPPRWHTWADQDDIEHAAQTGQPDPSDSRCGCRCADGPRGGGGVS